MLTIFLSQGVTIQTNTIRGGVLLYRYRRRSMVFNAHAYDHYNCKEIGAYIIIITGI